MLLDLKREVIRMQKVEEYKLTDKYKMISQLQTDMEENQVLNTRIEL